MAGPRAAAAALLPALLLAVLAPWAGRGAAAAPTAPNGTLGAELERRWESLVARSLARLPVASQPKEAAVQSGAGDYLLGIKRLRRLYCNVGIGFHLQVLPDGRIGGVHADTSDSEWGGGPGQHLPAAVGNRDRLGSRPLWPQGHERSRPPRSRRADCRCAPGRPSPASPPSEARALGAEFQRLRPWARDERRSRRHPRGPGERVQVGDGGAAWVLRSGAGRGRRRGGRAGRPASPRPRPLGPGGWGGGTLASIRTPEMSGQEARRPRRGVRAGWGGPGSPAPE